MGWKEITSFVLYVIYFIWNKKIWNIAPQNYTMHNDMLHECWKSADMIPDDMQYSQLIKN